MPCAPENLLLEPCVLCRGDRASQGFGQKRAETPKKASASALLEVDKRWQLEPHAKTEWEAWLAEQRELVSVQGGNMYLQARLCGAWLHAELLQVAWHAGRAALRLQDWSARCRSS